MFSFPSHPSIIASGLGSGSSATGRIFGQLPDFITDWLAGLSGDKIDIDDITPGLLKPVTGGSDSSEEESSEESSEESAPTTDYGFGEYLEGLFSSVGAENEVNRVFNHEQALAQREWQTEENEKNRVWQTEMANSAYQRAASDLKAAGLNPILAATNGSTSTPSGAVGAGSSASYNVGGGDTLSSVLNAFSGIASAIAEFLPANKVVQVFKALGKVK